MKTFTVCLYEWIGVMFLDRYVYESDFWDTLQSESQNFNRLAWIVDGWLILMTNTHLKIFWFRLDQITHPY